VPPHPAAAPLFSPLPMRHSRHGLEQGDRHGATATNPPAPQKTAPGSCARPRRMIMSGKAAKAVQIRKKNRVQKSHPADSAEKPGGVVVPACESAGKDQQRARPSSSGKANFWLRRRGKLRRVGLPDCGPANWADGLTRRSCAGRNGKGCGDATTSWQDRCNHMERMPSLTASGGL
jgi:hypothetical protein